MRAPSRQLTRRIAWALLGGAMCLSAAWLLLTARSTTFSGDDVYYYARFIGRGLYGTEVGSGIEYFLAPHNGHLQLGGKLIYRLLFETVGAEYTAFRAVNVAGILLVVGLFYVLARRRVGPVAALAPAILLLFFGYSWEVLIWAFDMHTVYALAFGLGALLALEGKESRRNDVLVCILLICSVAFIELGLAFVAGVAVSVLVRGDRWRRCWIVLVPALLYAIWMPWASQFHQQSVELTNVHLIPITVVDALSAIAGSVTGVNPTGFGTSVPTVGVTAAGTAFAFLFAVAVAYRIRLGRVPPSLWTFATVAVAYWITIALGGRGADTSRYLFAGTVMVFLVGADALKGLALRPLAIAAAFVVLALALPANIAKYYDGRRMLLNDAAATKTEYAMLELARDQVKPRYLPARDKAVIERGGRIFSPLRPVEYFRAAAEFGGLAGSLDELRHQPLNFREVADVTLARADRLHLQPASKPGRLGDCLESKANPGKPTSFDLPAAGVLLGSSSSQPVDVEVSRFAKDGRGFKVGAIEPESWVTLRAPKDAAPEKWRVAVFGPTEVCK
jgi:hypothetical protein